VVEDRYKEWFAAANKDAEALTNLYDEHPVLMRSKRSVISKAAIAGIPEACRRPALCAVHGDVRSTGFHVVGDIAIGTAFRWRLARDGKRIYFHGKTLLVWKKQRRFVEDLPLCLTKSEK
jgi:ketosteroid isomerase-like protein